MNVYVLATNLFAVAALLLGGSSYLKDARSVRLLPLFLLVVSHALALILMIVGWDQLGVVGALKVFSSLCLVWTLMGSVIDLTVGWRWLVWAGVAWMVSLVLLSLIPFWPIPPAIHTLLIAIFGASLIFVTVNETPWLHLIIPLILTLAAFLEVVGLLNTAGFVTLLAYVALLVTIHWHSLKISIHREETAQALVQEAADLDQERQRFLEASELISNVPNFNLSLEHIIRSLAQITHADQSAIFILNSNFEQEIRLLSLYSPQRSFHINDLDDVACLLSDCSLLSQIITNQQQLYLEDHQVELVQLYELWDNELVGPTLLQPLTIQGQSIGVLMLGNPISQNPISIADAHLCQHLAPQITLLVEHRRRYQKLESEAAIMAREAKQRAEAPNQQYAATLEKISDGVIVSNKAGRVEFVNQAAERILGRSGQTLIGLPIGAIYRKIDSKKPVDDLMVSFMERDQPLPTFVETAERAIQGRLIPWRNGQNEWQGIIAIFRDVSRAVKADRARNDFITALSQELRTPLTVVKGYSELIMNGMMGDYPPQQLHVQQIIHNSTERIVEILDNAIKTSAENRHRVLPRFEEVDPARIIEGMVREIMPLVQLHELTLRTEVEPDLPLIAADVKHLHRILYNLLSNACRFTPPGGLITIQAWSQEDNWGRTPQPYLFMTIVDNGVGISGEDLTRIFDRFYQVKQYPMQNGGGMGLGLTVVKELVELHHGRVWAESIMGKGSKFFIALPVNQEY